MGKPVTAGDARRIAHDVVGEHINHPAPHGHKGLEKVMALLDKAARAKLPAKDFAGGGPKGSKGFPMPDKEHARLAISGATRSERAGNISPAKEASIKARARRMLGDSLAGK